MTTVYDSYACGHITTASRRAALRDGGRYFDAAAHRWVCPWCEDWRGAVEEAAAVRVADEEAAE